MLPRGTTRTPNPHFKSWELKGKNEAVPYFTEWPLTNAEGMKELENGHFVNANEMIPPRTMTGG